MEAFAKYIDHERFRLTVVTVGTHDFHGFSQEGNVSVFRIKPRSRVFTPTFKSSDSKLWHYSKVAWKKLLSKVSGDELGFFVSKAFAYLRDLDRTNKVHLVISSFSPAAPHLAALKFCKTADAKWIVDMRDEMSLNPQSDTATRKYYAAIEAEIAKHAAALTSVSQPIVDYFKMAIPGLKYYVEIRNGFDQQLPKNSSQVNETFTLLHAGSFYGTRKPDTLLKAVANLTSKGLMPANWKFICAGAVKNFSIPDSITRHVEIQERVGQNEIFERMCKSDLNILIQPPTGRKGVYTGKIFEYIAAQKSILALVDPTDVAADLIRDFNAGYVVEFSDIAATERAILTALDRWKHNEFLSTDPDRIMQLHRKYQVQKLNLLIEKLLHEK